MTYYDSAEGQRVSSAHLQFILDEHGVVMDPEQWADLDRVAPVGPDGQRCAQRVLAWLGY